jgi:uncharacterized membrane protein YozB (DUF420 family)
MTTIAGALSDAAQIAGRGRFYPRMAALFLAVSVIGFVPTYWMPMARGTLSASPITHLHALLFYGWMLLFFWQTSLVAAGKMVRHREWGVAGVAIASATCVVSLGVSINSIKHFDAGGFGDAARAFSVVPVTAILLFAGLLAWALLKTRNAEVHKRLMLVATASLLQLGIGRWFAFFLAAPGPAAPPPVFVTIPPGILADLFIVAGMVYDRRTTGRVHRVYWIAGAAVLAVQLLRVPLSTTDAWAQLARWLVALSP